MSAPSSDDVPQQDALLALDEVAAAPRRGRRKPPLGAQEMASELPVARVLLDLQPAHLDREYDYLVPAAMADDALPGVRVRARFGAQEVDGFVVARLAESEHEGRLLPLRRLVSAEPVLTPPVLRLVRAVAERWAGTTADVLRLAIPPRHARTEKEEVPDPGPGDGALGAAPGAAPEPWAGLWSPYRGGDAFSAHVSAGGAPKAVWTPLPGLAPAADPGGVPSLPHWAAAVATAARAAVAAGRGVLVVVPDARDAGRVGAALAAAGVPDVARLLAEDGPAPRYRAFLAAARGRARVVVGTRAAMFAPVADLGLVVLWGDGEDTLAEPHAPYPHAREVLALRSDLEGAAFLLGSPGRTVQAQALLDGWAREVAAPRDVVRARAPRMRALTSVELAAEGPGAAARIPTAAWRAARDALAQGPVLVQVPRTGYLPVVACVRCRTPATCDACHGPLGLGGAGAAPQCRWCGRLAAGWRCGECGSTALRAVRVGSERTAEELGRAFPGVPVRLSASTAPGGVLDRVPARPAVVVATPGAEPVADGGYAAALLLDAAVATATLGLATGTQAVHRWLAAAHLVRPATAGGQVLLVGDAAPGPTGALVRFDPAGFAARELAERAELALPPAVRVAAVTGDRAAVGALVARVGLATPEATLGPVETEPAGAGDGSLFDGAPVRVVVRVPAPAGVELARQLRASLAVRSAHREPGTVRVQLDPEEMV
ncbi:primosomal protein N' [Xylanimonas sp. McL0601]|uniref:primosomal protein N' family DNA-binding protein n=1 Tax=Xylanimonas sp. McL0601 TaxID=3414739 RepID=UPI003CFBB1C5